MSKQIINKVMVSAGTITIAPFLLWMLMTLLAAQGQFAQAAYPTPDDPAETVLASTKGLTPPITINEVMVSNFSTVSDEAGDFDNWIELYNAGRLPLDVGGMGLSNASSFNPWLIPTGTVIPSLGYLLIWADGEPHEGAFHTDFILAPGQIVSLLDKQVFGQVLIDRMDALNTIFDWSRARHPNGNGKWTLFNRPSPGTVNATCWFYLPVAMRSDPRGEKSIFINELMAANAATLADPAGEYDDWIELYNPGPYDIDLSGMYLSDDMGNLPRWQISPGTIISANHYLIFWADDQESQGLLHTNFKLSRDGEMVLLTDADGYSLLDQVAFSAQQDDVSFGRLPDSVDNWQSLSTPSPGQANSPDSIQVSATAHWPTVVGISDTVTVTTRVAATYMPVTTTLFYDTGDGFTQTAMLDDGAHGDGIAGDGIYGAQIPPGPSSKVVYYYVHIQDRLGDTITDPSDAPGYTHAFAKDLPLGTLVINEFMAANDSVISDAAGDFDDWIELYNAGAITLDLGGFYLSDDLGEPALWRIPAGTKLPAGGFLLLWADGEPDEGTHHASFKLSANGEAVGLFGPDGVTAVDALTFTAQIEDVSWGRYPDGAGDWSSMAVPTPGYTNTLGTTSFGPTGTLLKESEMPISNLARCSTHLEERNPL